MEFVSGWEGELPTSLSAGTFTPFLGAGASSLRSRDEISFDAYPWSNVGKTLVKIYVDVGGNESRSFLRAFAQHRLQTSEDWLDEFMPKDASAGLPRQLAGDDLIDLQVALVRAMRRLTAIFGNEFIEQVPSLRELPDCAVSFSFQGEAEQDAWAKLCEAAAIAKKLRDRKKLEASFRGADAEWLPAKAHRAFNIARVYERLAMLTWLLVGQEPESFKAQFRKQFKENPDLARVGNELIEANVPRGKLRLDMLQWLADLLEYSLIYWIQRFPTTLELAFELGLAVKGGPPRRPELAQAAQAFASDAKEANASDYIKELMEYCESGMKPGNVIDPAYRRFYVAIAAALCDQWERYSGSVLAPGAARAISETEQFRRIASGQVDRVEGGAMATDEAPPRVGFMPIAATTNYDSGLELVFAEFEIPYHVLFPVQTGNADGRAKVPWVFRTVLPGRTPNDMTMLSGAPRLPDKATLQGPVIVKLHGAPTLQEAADGLGGYFKHKIVVSEKEYLDALQEGSSSLNWFEDEMFKPLDDEERHDPASRARSIWFLGYSIADWNVRLRLYSHLRGARRDERPLRAVNRDYDPFRQAILRPLKVLLCRGDLNKVPDAILEHYGDCYGKCSRAVQRLLDDLEGAAGSREGRR